MLHGLLLVLKIAGIILAVLLGIVLAAAAAVLFVPVRYTADAQYDKNSGKKPVLHVRVTWLLHLFRFFMEYNEGFKMRAQVLFFPLYDSERPIEPEIKEQKEKAERIRKAYIDSIFTEEEYKSELGLIENQIKDINSKLIENSQVEQLNFTTEDILLKRDMDFINKVKLPISYYAFNDNWADIIMRYIDDVELEIKNGKLVVKQINFRSTFYNEFNKLYTKGYIDRKRPLTYDFNGVCVDTNIRYSEYLPIKDVMQHLYRLNEYYEVNLYKGTYYKETEKLDIVPLQRNEVPIRVFPLQKDNNGDKNWLSMGMLATKNNPNDIKVNIRDVFETIPDNVTEEDFLNA